MLGALAPLYLIGLAALSLPLVFHLIRRTPRGEQQFSTLMFLRPSPPRITRRSRLDNILLLILRATAVALLAFAFTRPLIRQDISLSLNSARSRQVAILVDTSASMRHGDTWRRANDEIDKVLDDLEPGDQVGLFSYDDGLQTIVDFSDEPTELDTQQRLIRAALRELEPGWMATNLPEALMKSADHVIATSRRKDSGESPLCQIIAVTDMQAGQDLTLMNGYEWPENVRLSLISVSQPTSNAGVRLLTEQPDRRPDRESNQIRARIENAGESIAEQMTLQWLDADERVFQDVSYYVPAGEQRVVKLSPPAGGREVVGVRLSGDDATFDNDFYVATPRKDLYRVKFVGNHDTEDNEGLHYFLDLALIDRPERTFELEFVNDEDLANWQASPADWIVVARPVAQEPLESIVAQVELGAQLLVVVSSPEMEAVVTEMLGTEVAIEEAEVSGYALLGRVDFEDPLFAPFADPQFSDFTGIHFWRYRKLTADWNDDVQELARFDSGDPYLLRRSLGDGTVSVMTSGWQTDDSQLARSSKFLPILAGLAGDPARRSDPLYFEVGEPITIPPSTANDKVTVTRPDGERIELDEEQTEYRGADRPGRYRIDTPAGDYTVAVNLSADETDISPISPEALEPFGVTLGMQPTMAEQVAWERDLRDRELEERQKLWAWIIAAAMLFLFAEMFVAGTISLQRTQAETA